MVSTELEAPKSQWLDLMLPSGLVGSRCKHAQAAPLFGYGLHEQQAVVDKYI